MAQLHSVSGSPAEDVFIDIFTEAFGAEKAGFLYSQYPFYDIYQNIRYADFVLNSTGNRIAIEIDNEASHKTSRISQDKFQDDLLRQNSMIFLGWDVYRFAVRQLQTQPDMVKDELRTFLGHHPLFKEDEFGYLIVDESHHAAAETYQRVLAYFRPYFTLGLTATPERADDKDILDVFKNTAHKLDIQTAVEIGELVPIRCIRIHTNIDLTSVRINSMLYKSHELESKVFVPERNSLIVNTYLEFAKSKKTVVFCASVRHANEIAELFVNEGINALAVSGEMKGSQRKEQLERYEHGDICVLCACDLLNEGWDSPKTEVLFMARPTMSKVLYTQQLGRGMRKAEGKESLMVFDFVDNANRYNMPYSIHRLFQLKDYRPGSLAVAEKERRYAEENLYKMGEKPDAIIDYPVSATDYELVDIFNWQDEVQDMISQSEFVRRVNVQSETIERYVREGKLVPDMAIPMRENRTYKYFKPEKLEEYAKQYDWIIITDENRKDLFMQMVR